jgi:hypothetical protein
VTGAAVFGPWPDEELLLCEVLDRLTVAEAVTDLPGDLQEVLPLQRVRRIGGAGPDSVTDVARVDVEAYGATREQARALAKAQQQVLLGRPPATAAGLIDRVETEVGPRRLPYTDPAIVLYQATYRVSVRRWSAVPYLLP